jgi:hypothetical protein
MSCAALAPKCYSTSAEVQVEHSDHRLALVLTAFASRAKHTLLLRSAVRLSHSLPLGAICSQRRPHNNTLSCSQADLATGEQFKLPTNTCH